MPFKSKKQKRFFGMCAHNPGIAKGKCPPKEVIKEFFAEERKQRKKRK